MQLISLTEGKWQKQIVQTAAETMKTLYCSTTANTVGNKGREDL